MKHFVCANCGEEIHGGVYMCLDNYQQVNFFENNKLNRFCSEACFCEYMSLEVVEDEEVPLDEDEEDEDIEDEEDYEYE